MAQLTDTDVQRFREALRPLKKWNRPEILSEEDADLLERLYEDPYPDQHLLRDLKAASTSFLVGRRGTGKSTMFQRAQLDLRREHSVITAYVDLLAVQENSNVGHLGVADDFAKQLVWFQGFLRILLADLAKDLAERANRGFFNSLLNKKRQVLSQLEKLQDVERYIANVDLTHENTLVRHTIETKTSTVSGGVGASPADLGARVGIERGTTRGSGLEIAGQVSRIFQVSKFVDDLKAIVAPLEVKHVYIFLDDYSEMNSAAMQLLLDQVVYPLEIAGRDLIKFKIAALPGFYHGKFDPQKLDLLHLDFSFIYRASAAGDMMALGADYIQRLLSKRLNHFTGKPLPHYFAVSLNPAVPELLFLATFGNPRALGWILNFAADETLAHYKKITAESIRNGARKYFEEVVERRIRSFGSEGDSHLMLGRLNAILIEARRLRTSSDVGLNGDDRRTAYASHFHCDHAIEAKLNALCNVQAINYWGEGKDRDGRHIDLYALDFGLCQRESIPFGKPDGIGIKEYARQRIFDFTEIVASVDAAAQNAEASAYSDSAALTPMQRRVLSAIYAAGPNRVLAAKHIAETADISSRVVAKVAQELATSGYVEREKIGQIFSYRLADQARESVARLFG